MIAQGTIDICMVLMESYLQSGVQVIHPGQGVLLSLILVARTPYDHSSDINLPHSGYPGGPKAQQQQVRDKPLFGLEHNRAEVAGAGSGCPQEA